MALSMIWMNFSRLGAPATRQTLACLLGAMLLSSLGSGVAGAASPPPSALPAPLTTSAPPEVEADAAWTEILAGRALRAGMYFVAEGLYRRALGREEGDSEARRLLQLGLASTLIAQSRGDDALAVLEAIPGEHDDAWRLRRGIVAFLASDFVSVRTLLPTIEANRLPVADVAWYHFLRAMRQEQERDRSTAESFFENAIANSVSVAATAWFRLAQFQFRLNVEEPTEAMLAQLRRNREDYENQPLGIEYTLLYAAALDRLDRKTEAIAVLIAQRNRMPRGESEWRDRTLLLLGLIAGADSPDGLDALTRLLKEGNNAAWQRVALQRLVAASSAPAAQVRAALSGLLNELLARTPQHPLTEDLLYHRASLALQEQRYEDAEADANALRTRFPGSALRADALALLASSSWQRTRYRSAADYAAQLRAEHEDPRERARLAVLVGESYFRAGEDAGTAEDFRNAADAYGQAQEDIAQLAADTGRIEAERLAGATLGALFFQRVLALIRGGNLDRAAELLSGPAVEEIEPESRWQAAWNFVRFLQLNRKPDDAFQRLEAWGAAQNAPPGLRLKFLWMLAQLALESGRGQPEVNARLADVRAFLAGPGGASVDAATRVQVESNAALLEAKALLANQETAAGIQALDKLRRDFPESNAAIFSYIEQAHHLAAAGQLVDAQKLLVGLVDTYPRSEYAPRALYEAAEQAQRRGQDAQFIEAKELLERLAREYPQDRYEFFARLKQGDILRKLNQFAAAEQVYLSLENRYPNHPDRHVAQLSLAVTLMAQVDNDPAKFESAISRLERLTDSPAAPTDVRVEAGYRLGYGWQNHGDANRATEVYWDLYQRFLGEAPAGGRPPALGARGRYWLAKALLDLGEIHFRAGRRDNARRSFQLVLDHALPGEALANGGLEQLRSGD